MIIGILGGGQLGMMLCQVASKLNIQTFAKVNLSGAAKRRIHSHAFERIRRAFERIRQTSELIPGRIGSLLPWSSSLSG